MIIVAESGSTKTDWILIKGESTIKFESSGIHPLFLDKTSLISEVRALLSEQINLNIIEKVYFYGPGTGTDERAKLVKSPLTTCFPHANIEVNTDLLAAARALFQKQEGIACILGTGSNSGVYDGHFITDNIPSLGYILGDEGSGAHLGLSLLKKVLNHELEAYLEKRFYSTYDINIPEVINRVYKQSYPNRFLASFTPFILQEINQPSIRKIVEISFETFIQRHILPYPKAKHLPIGFVGSIAFYFKDVLIELCNQHGLEKIEIVQKPIDKLVEYHRV